MVSRRDALKQIAAAGAGLRPATRLRPKGGQQSPIVIAGKPVEILVASTSRSTVHITVFPLDDNRIAQTPAYTGALASTSPGDVRARARQSSRLASVRAGGLRLRYTENPPTIHVETSSGETVQRLTFDATAP